MKILKIYFPLLFCTAWAAHAQLTWTTKSASTTVFSDAGTATTEFSFKNTGKHTIRLLEIQPDCYCTAAASSTSVIEPGKTGSVKVVFSVGDRIGKQIQTVRVVTDDRHSESSVLIFEVQIEPLASVASRFVYWNRGEAPEPKSTNIVLRKDRGVYLEAVETEGNAFSVRVVPGENGKEPLLEITPISTERRVFQSILVRARTPRGTIEFPVVARVL
ncbi:MAG TPA: DUF1573 domain-containing protein [Chthoniobacterales bacterium]